MKLKLEKFIFPLLLVFYEISTYLSNDMYLPALPQMMTDLGLNMQTAQLTLTVWFLGSASMPLVMGVLSDCYGRRPVLLIGGIIYIFSTIICAMTSTVSIFLITRFIQGAMIPSMMVAGYACIHELYEKIEAIRMLALMGSIVILAPAFGPLLGAVVLIFFSWRGIFWIITLLSMIAILLLAHWMPETLPIDKRRTFYLKPLLKNYWDIISNKKFMQLMLVLGFAFAGFITWLTAGPLLVIQSFHYTAVVFGIIQAGIFIAYMIGTRLVKYLLKWIGAERLIQLGLTITLGGGLWMLVASIYFPYSLALFVTGMTMYSLGSALYFSPLNRVIIESSEAPMGLRVAIFTVGFTGFAALGSGVASLFFSGSIASLAGLISTGISISYLIFLM